MPSFVTDEKGSKLVVDLIQLCQISIKLTKAVVVRLWTADGNWQMKAT